MNIKIFKSFTEALDYSKAIPKADQEAMRAYLQKKWQRSEIIGDIDILADASLFFLLIVNTLEELGRSNNVSCELSCEYLTFLNNNRCQFFKNFGFEECSPYIHKTYKSVISLDYEIFGKQYEILNKAKLDPSVSVNQAFWQAVYLIVHAIYLKDTRQASTWFQAAVSFYKNSVLEYGLTTYVPGLSFFNRGVRHDKLCPVSGTSDPDFWYLTSDGLKFPAEFKQPTKTIEALAYYSFKYPDYIYNAKFLFSYGQTANGILGFYKIDYTRSPFTITAIDVDRQLIEVIKATGNK
jgi:hypothetical protein